MLLVQGGLLVEETVRLEMGSSRIVQRSGLEVILRDQSAGEHLLLFHKRAMLKDVVRSFILRLDFGERSLCGNSVQIRFGARIRHRFGARRWALHDFEQVRHAS